MLVKTEFCDTLKKAKITLQCKLQSAYYRYGCKCHGTLDLRAIADELRDVEYNHINPSGDIEMTLRAVTPIPVEFNMNREWLVVELVGNEKMQGSNWVKFLTESTARIMDTLAPATDGETRIATVEYGYSNRFVVMDDNSINNHDKSSDDYIVDYN